jgi:hypothetical protein
MVYDNIVIIWQDYIKESTKKTTTPQKERVEKCAR